MSCYDRPDLLEYSEALSILLDQVDPISEVEILPIEQIASKILAQDLTSPLDIPPQDNSAMDGYAINQVESSQAQFKVIGKSMAGHPYSEPLLPNQAVRIMTGAVVPTGADTVIMQERANLHEDLVSFDLLPSIGSNIRRQGEQLKQGEVALSKGQLLTPQALGLIASLGISEVPVFRSLKIALLSSGDELVKPGNDLQEGEIYESNRCMIAAMIRKLGAEVIDMGIIPDDKNQLSATFLKASKEADVIISTGGVSVGEADYTREVLDELGQIEFWRLAIKPGKPLAFGKIEKRLFFGLPGNPVSAFVTFHQLAVTAIRKLQGRTISTQPPKYLSAVASDTFFKSPGRMDFQRCQFEVNDQGLIEARPSGNQGSALLTSIVQANGYAVLERERGKVEPGEQVKILPFDGIVS